MLDKLLKSRKVNVGTPMGRAVSIASVIGLHMVVSVFIGFGIGFFLDSYFETSPWLTIIFLFLGIIAGFKNMLTMGKSLLLCQKEMEEEQCKKSFQETMDHFNKNFPLVSEDSEDKENCAGK